jgi:MinD-like ATPase involved in chromosome partitioning or flagellar assembly
MTSVAVASVADAPGASTLAVGLSTTWPFTGEPAVLVEADPDGGRLGTRLGVGVEPGLMSLALATRTTALRLDDVIAASASIGEALLLPAPPSAEQAQSALVYCASALAAVIAGDTERAWVLDVGRVSPRSPAMPLAAKADDLLLVSRGDLAALQLLPTRLDALRAAGCRRPSVVVVGPTPWSLDQVAEFTSTDVIAQLPLVLGSGGLSGLSERRWRPWWLVVGGLAALLAARAAEGLS